MRSKRPGPKERGVEDVGAVGGGDDDDVRAGIEAVHLDEDLVEGLLALVVAAAEAGAALAADGVDFVDEDDAGGVLLGLVEEVADAAGADADEHLDEFGTGDAEERHAGFAGDGAREQRLTGAGRADQQHALGDARAERGELLRVLEELDDFGELFLGFIDAGHVGEGDGDLAAGEQAGAALAEAHGLRVRALRLPHDEQQEETEEEEREEVQEQAQPRAEAGRVLVFEVDGGGCRRRSGAAEGDALIGEERLEVGVRADLGALDFRACRRSSCLM